MLKIREAHYGKDHLEVAQTMSNLAQLYADQGNGARAASMQKRALGTVKRVLGPKHPQVKAMRNQMRSFMQGVV